MALSYQYPRDVVKVIVLGATGTGKTALCNQLVNHSFQAQHQHTRTVDSYFLPMPKLCIDPTHHPDETTAVTVELVDTPGETTKPVLPMTPEARLSQTASRRYPRPAHPKQYREDEYEETVEGAVATGGEGDRGHVTGDFAKIFGNKLWAPRPPMVFLIMLSLKPREFTASLEKARALCDMLCARGFMHGPVDVADSFHARTQCVLFSNLDDTVGDNVLHFSKAQTEVQSIIASLDRKNQAYFTTCYGSVRFGYVSFKNEPEVSPDVWHGFDIAGSKGFDEVGTGRVRNQHWPLDHVLRCALRKFLAPGEIDDNFRSVCEKMYSDMDEESPIVDMAGTVGSSDHAASAGCCGLGVPGGGVDACGVS